MALKLFTTFCLFINCLFAYSQSDSSNIQYFKINNELTYGYHKPKVFDIFTNIPKNYVDLGKGLGEKKNLLWVGIAVAATGVIIPGDQDFTDHVQNLANSTKLDEPHKFNKLFAGLEYPANTSATFYYFGHGNVSLLFASGFLITGLVSKDYRAINTSIEIGESIITLGVLTQGLKRVFGRQDPSSATVAGGEWNFFPNQRDYMKNTANYDAMPSGHMATLISTITVISKNYPEYRWIKPIGYSMATLMGVEMMNSGVHWASDFPIGILIGYTVATVSVNRRITKVHSETTSNYLNKLQPQFFVSSVYGTPVYGVKAVF